MKSAKLAISDAVDLKSAVRGRKLGDPFREPDLKFRPLHVPLPGNRSLFQQRQEPVVSRFTPKTTPTMWTMWIFAILAASACLGEVAKNRVR